MKFFKIFFILFLSIGVLLISSCRDECKDQICLNGGVCDEGNCQCPDGYSGSNCETKVDGYNCFNGDCVYTPSNAQYSSIVACQTSCSNSNTNNFNCQNGNCIQVNGNGQYTTLAACQSDCSTTNLTGFNCQSGNCVQVSSNGQYSTLAACQSACAASTATLTFKNNTFTVMDITFNNITKTIAPSGSTSFSGIPNSSASGTAQTSGRTSSGDQVGLLMSWNLSYTFPASGNASINLNVSSDYFFLRMQNAGSSAMSPIYVNYGLLSETVDNISIPNNNVLYNLGYYKAWTNTNVRGIRGNSYTYWNQGVHFNLPFTINQSATLLNNLLQEEAGEE